MTLLTKECDAFLVDTYHSLSDGAYHPGAITLKRSKSAKSHKTMEVLQWKKAFHSQDEADAFVRKELSKLDLEEVSSV